MMCVVVCCVGCVSRFVISMCCVLQFVHYLRCCRLFFAAGCVSCGTCGGCSSLRDPGHLWRVLSGVCLWFVCSVSLRAIFVV